MKIGDKYTMRVKQSTPTSFELVILNRFAEEEKNTSTKHTSYLQLRLQPTNSVVGTKNINNDNE